MMPYYHTTRYADLGGIAAVGLLPREGSGVYEHSLYAQWSQGKVFAADADAALEWFGKIADLTEYHHGDDQEPDRLVPVMLRLDLDGFELHEDSIGQEDVCSGRSVYVEAVVPPERIDYWQPGQGWTPITEHEQANVFDGVMDTEEFEDGTVAFQVYGPYDDGGFKPTAVNAVERLPATTTEVDAFLAWLNEQADTERTLFRRAGSMTRLAAVLQGPQRETALGILQTLDTTSDELIHVYAGMPAELLFNLARSRQVARRARNGVYVAADVVVEGNTGPSTLFISRGERGFLAGKYWIDQKSGPLDERGRVNVTVDRKTQTLQLSTARAEAAEQHRRALIERRRRLEQRRLDTEGALERLPAPTVDRDTRRRQLKAYALAGEKGRYWYQRAEEEIRIVAKAWNVDPVYVAVAAAATSPATPVVGSPRMTRGGGTASNIGKARRVIKRQAMTGRGSDAINAQSPGASLLLAYEQCTAAGRDAYDCLEQAFPNPQTTKTHAFVRNLLGFEEPVTVDTLVGRAAGLPTDKKGRVMLTDNRYREVAEDITAVARELGWAPREVMAAIWTAAGGSGDFTLATKAERRRGRSQAS